jgi:hypothetical protein
VPLTFLSAAYVLGLSKRKAREGKKKKDKPKRLGHLLFDSLCLKTKGVKFAPKKKRLNALIPLGLFGDLQDSTST